MSFAHLLTPWVQALRPFGPHAKLTFLGARALCIHLAGLCTLHSSTAKLATLIGGPLHLTTALAQAIARRRSPFRPMCETAVHWRASVTTLRLIIANDIIFFGTRTVRFFASKITHGVRGIFRSHVRRHEISGAFPRTSIAATGGAFPSHPR